MTTDQLIGRLMRPTYVLQMAKPREYEDSPYGRGAHKRAEQARQDIDTAVMAYANAKAIDALWQKGSVATDG